MKKQHDIDYYKDGHLSVAFCKICSAEGEKFLEDCPEKIIHTNEKSIDEKKLSAK